MGSAECGSEDGDGAETKRRKFAEGRSVGFPSRWGCWEWLGGAASWRDGCLRRVGGDAGAVLAVGTTMVEMGGVGGGLVTYRVGSGGRLSWFRATGATLRM